MNLELFVNSHKVTHHTKTVWQRERTACSLLDKARSMAFQSKLPAHLWPEAVSTANYLINRTATRANAGTTPYERLTGRKPSLHHLKIFGCRTFVRNTKPSLSKWEPRSTECIFLGYDSTSRGFRNYHRASKRVLISKDVEFDERTFPYWFQRSVPAASEELPFDWPMQPQTIDLEDSSPSLDQPRPWSGEREPHSPCSPLRPPNSASSIVSGYDTTASQVRRIEAPEAARADETPDPYLPSSPTPQRSGPSPSDIASPRPLGTPTEVSPSQDAVSLPQHEVVVELKLTPDTSHLADVPLFT